MRDLGGRLGVKPAMVPMSDDPVRTMVTTTDQGELAFQDWFVRLRCEPVVDVRPLRRRRQGAAASGADRARRPARHRRLPIQSVRQRGADPGGAGRPRRARAAPRRRAWP